LVGESGCGKSVTAQAILRIIPKPGLITQGQILLHRSTAPGSSEEFDLAQVDATGQQIRSIRGKDIAMIFQEPMSSLSPVHTVGAQIIEVIRLHQTVTKAEARQRAIQALRLVGIPRPEMRVDAYSFELSGGMRQRAMIAIALACRPSLLIADEPTTALDVTIQAQILELMQRLQQEMGMSILLITHNLGVVAALSHRVAVMYLGRIVEQATKEEIFNHPKHPYTQGLLNSVPRVGDKKGRRLWAIEGVVPHPYAQIQGCAFHPRCPKIMRGVCDKEYPPTVEVGTQHSVACYLYGGKEAA
jgi:peptide/nickel transport system ATP-binding protein